jgi:hypothetical protein
MNILYHYCSTASFQAIIQSGSVWLSSLSLSNDTMEGRLVAATLARLAQKDGLDASATQRLQEALGLLERMIDGLGFCLSEDGDLLSQWRGYAADATGVTIGFSKDYLNWLSDASRGQPEPGFTLQKVEYDPAAQDSQIEPTYRQIRKLIDAGAFKRPGARLLDTRSEEEVEKEASAIRSAYRQLSFAVLSLFTELFRLKSYAFREEREWRLLSHFVKVGGDRCLYRALHDRIVPYRSFQLREPERNAIIEVILGPKHTTPTQVVEAFLKQHNFGEAQVKRSEASYR